MNASTMTINNLKADTNYTIRTIGIEDLKFALRRGLDDFTAFPSHGLFLCLVYPVIGLFLGRLAFGYDILPLLFPLAAGFALLGPFAAVGLYELSRRRECGQAVDVGEALSVLRQPGAGALLILGLLLAIIFVLWLIIADTVYSSIFGSQTPTSLSGFAKDVFGSSRGWALIVIGNAVGFLFSAVVLAISVISFPMIIDRKIGALTAIRASVNAVAQSPRSFAIWGLIVAASLAAGSLPVFAGLPLVLPVLGHATWHLYRRTIG